MHSYRNGNNKRYPLGSLVVNSLLAIVLLTGCGSGSTGSHVAETAGDYTCSMHPQIHRDGPGDCPICGMKLTLAEADTDSVEVLDSALRYLTDPVTETVVGQFNVIAPQVAAPGDTIVATGYVGFDPRDVHTVSTRVAGRIERLHVHYRNQAIRKGQALMALYSPQLLSAQRDLLLAFRDNDTLLTARLKARLRNLGMQDTEIQKVIATKQPLPNSTIYSPYSGIARETNPGAAATTPAEGLDIREGMYVKQGQTLLTIQSLNRTRAILNVFTPDVWQVDRGDRVLLYKDNDGAEIVPAKVDFIPPGRLGKEKTTRVIVYLHRVPKDWKIGTLLHGQIIVDQPDTDSSLFIPLVAVNRLGRRNVVWIQDKTHPDVFHARSVQLGVQRGERIQVVSGMDAGDKIAANAAYMVDGDSFVD